MPRPIGTPLGLDQRVERLEKLLLEPDVQLAAQEIRRLFEANLSFGVPINDDGNQLVRHMRGSWVTLNLTAATGTVTVTHNLNIPTVSVTGAGGTANLPNVRWLVWGLVHGDRTGTNAPPAAATGNVTLMKNVGATVTVDAIDLRYMVTGFVPSAIEPLQVTLWVIPAVV